MVAQRLATSFAAAFFLATLNVPCYSQDPPAAITASNACEGLNGVAPNVRAIARNLKVCPDLEFITRPRANPEQLPATQGERQQPPGGGTLREELANPAFNQSSELAAHQRITERVTQAALHSNIVESQIHTVLLQMQVSAWNEEQKAYRRTKILNAFLGTTVGAVGTGLQFSNSVTVQHVGDGISVAGGVLSVIFAFCTAGLGEQDSPPVPFLQSFANNNEDHVIPEDVWSYLSDVKAPAPTKKLLSCHLNGAPQSQDAFLNRLKVLNELESRLSTMNRDAADLLQSIAPR